MRDSHCLKARPALVMLMLYIVTLSGCGNPCSRIAAAEAAANDRGVACSSSSSNWDSAHALAAKRAFQSAVPTTKSGSTPTPIAFKNCPPAPRAKALHGTYSDWPALSRSSRFRATAMAPSSSPVAPLRNDRAFFIFNAVVSVAALALLGWLLLIHGGLKGSSLNLRFMPAVNACFNATAAVLLVAGRFAIARKRVELHRYLMVSAFAASALFLVGYLAYHAVHGDTKFGGTGAIRMVYLLILGSHVLLSTTIVPMALSAFYFAWRGDFRKHTRVTRVLHPIWLYVSVTGVAVFLMLRPYYPASPF